MRDELKGREEIARMVEALNQEIVKQGYYPIREVHLRKDPDNKNTSLWPYSFLKDIKEVPLYPGELTKKRT